MQRRSQYQEDYDYGDDDYYEDSKKEYRHFKKNKEDSDRRKRWDKENHYGHSKDYDDR